MQCLCAKPRAVVLHIGSSHALRSDLPFSERSSRRSQVTSDRDLLSSFVWVCAQQAPKLCVTLSVYAGTPLFLPPPGACTYLYSPYMTLSDSWFLNRTSESHRLQASFRVLLAMSYYPSYSAPTNLPTQDGQSYALGPYGGQYQAAPQQSPYGGPYQAPPQSVAYGNPSAPHQQTFWQSGNHLATGPLPDGRASFDSSATTAFYASAQGCGNDYNQAKGKGSRTSAPSGSHGGGGGCCVIM